MRSRRPRLHPQPTFAGSPVGCPHVATPLRGRECRNRAPDSRQRSCGYDHSPGRVVHNAAKHRRPALLHSARTSSVRRVRDCISQRCDNQPTRAGRDDLCAGPDGASNNGWNIGHSSRASQDSFKNHLAQRGQLTVWWQYDVSRTHPDQFRNLGPSGHQHLSGQLRGIHL